jgi:hypothetical protein
MGPADDDRELAELIFQGTRSRAYARQDKPPGLPTGASFMTVRNGGHGDTARRSMTQAPDIPAPQASDTSKEEA